MAPFLRFGAAGLDGPFRLRQLVARLRQGVGVGAQRGVDRGAFALGLGQGFAERFEIVRDFGRRLLAELRQPRPQPFRRLGRAGDAVFAKTPLALVRVDASGVFFPLALTTANLRLRLLEPLRGCAVRGFAAGQLRLLLLQLPLDVGDAPDVGLKLDARFLLLAGERAEFGAQLADAPPVESNGLLQVACGGVHFVLGALRFGEGVALPAVLRALRFHLRLQGDVFALRFLQAKVQRSRRGGTFAQLFAQRRDADGKQLGFALALFGLQLLIALGGGGLPLQMPEATFKVGANVREAG